jgi:flagellar biosynthesis chaperone FliJ
MNTNETFAITAMTLVTNSLTALFTQRAVSRKTGKEADAIVSDALAKRTQQLFDNLSKVVEDQQKKIKAMEASLENCHKQHAQGMAQYGETLKRLDTQRERIETLEAALRSSL